MAAMTGEQIYHNFSDGKPGPLQDAAHSVGKLAGSYQGIAQKFEAAQNRMMQSWTGGAAQAASHGAAPLAPAMRLSAEHLSGYASAHNQQWQAFDIARRTVQPVPPMPAALDPMELIKIGITRGPGAELEAIKSHQDAVAAHNAAAEHNVRVMDGYQGATDVNRNIPANYPWPKYGGGTFSTEDDGGDKPGGDDDGDSRESGGGGEKTGPGGSGLSGPGGGLPNGAVEASSVGTLPPTKDVDDTWTNRRLDPAPATPPPPTDPPIVPPANRGDKDKDKHDDGKSGWPEEEGPEGPEPPGPDLGEDDLDDGTTPASSSSGDLSAWRDSSNFGPVAGPWGAGDRAGGDASRAGGGTAFGPGGPGDGLGAGRGAGAAAGAGFRSGTAGGRGGVGGFGGAAPPRGRGEEDDEHNRPEYLVEPDPNSLFGTDEQASSPVIGAAWKPE